MIARAFTPRTVIRLRHRIQAIADRLLDRVLDRGEMDLVADFAYPLPVQVIAKRFSDVADCSEIMVLKSVVPKIPPLIPQNTKREPSQTASYGRPG